MSVVKPYIQTLFFVCFLLSGNAFAQNVTPINYNDENGLPSNLVYSIIQDRLGYIWMATEKGVVKYDGYDIRVFTTKDGLPSDDIWNISEDNLGNKWLHTNYSKVLGFIKGNKYKVVYIDTNVLRCYNLFHVGHKTYFENVTGNGHDGRVEIMEYNSLKDTTSKLIVAISTNKLQTLPISDKLELFKIDSNGNLGVVKNLFAETSQYQPLCDSFFDFYGLMHVSKVHYPIIDDEYIVYSFQSSLIKVLKPYECSIDTVSLQSFGCHDDEYIVLIYYVKDKEEYWLVTNKQLLSLNKDLSFKKTLIDRREYEHLGVSVCYLTEDNQYSDWYSTTDNGALYKPSASSVFKQNTGLSCLQNAKLSSASGGLVTYWYDVDLAKLYIVSEGSLKDSVQFPLGSFANYVSSYKEDSVISISTSVAFYLYDLNKRELLEITKGKKVTYNNILLSDYTKHMAVKGIQHHWYNDSTVYTSNLGLVVNHIYPDSVNVQTNVFENQHPFKSHYYDSTRNIYWLSNLSDLVCYNPEKEKKYRLNGLRKLLGTASINSVNGDKFGNIYVYNSDDLFLLYPELGVLKKLNTGFSLYSGHFAISGNTIVVAGDFGLAFAQIKGKGDVSSFKVIPNSKRFAYKSVNNIVLYNNKVTLVTTAGTYNIDLNSDNVLRVAKEISDNSFMSLLMESPREMTLGASADNDTLTVDQNLQLIKLNLINFSGEGEVLYRCQIGEGKWNANESGEVFIGNLKPGIVHQIKCKASDEIWQTPVKTLNIYRVPSWYQTTRWETLFWIAGVSAFIILILITVSITKKIADSNAEKKQQMTDLQLRAIYSQINPHFIFNSLASALYFIDNKKFDDAYNHVSKFSKLLRGYLKSSQERFVVLEDEIKMLKNYIELQQTRFEEKFEYSITVDNKIPVQSIMIPSLLLQPIVENAINHGLFHMVEKGKLDITFKQGEDSDELICKIEDNGVGREKATQIKKDSSNSKESYGTHLTEKLMEIFKDYEHMNISMKYIDKESPEHGTIVILSIKNLKYVV